MGMHKFAKLIRVPFLGFQKLSKIKKIIVVIIVVALIIAIQQYFQNKTQDNYIIEKAKTGSITEIVSESGNIEMLGKTDIYSPSTGIIDSVMFKNGDSVLKDQKLFTVKSTATVQEQQAAYANYLAAKATLDAANSTAYSLRSDMYSYWKTFRDMATNSTYEDSDKNPKKDERLAAEFQQAQDEWLAAEKQYKDQQTAISQAQAAVNSTWLLYQATQNATVLAQSDGVISNLSVGVGDNVRASNGSVLGVGPVLSIANFSKYTVKLSLNEADIYKVKTDQKATLELDSYKSKKYKGVVVRVDDIGTNENGIVKYNVYIEIKNPDDKLKFGMTMDVDIITSQLKNILTVPNSAIKPYKNDKAVRIINKRTNQIEYVPVEIGIKGDKYTQIIKGIKEGQEVITSLKNEQIKRKGMFGI